MKFEKISKEQWIKDNKVLIGKIGEFDMSELALNPIFEHYNEIKLPKRATIGSAGYDFYAPFDIKIPARGVVQFPTGIRCQLDSGCVLMLYPRSGLGFKYGISLHNTIGVIDEDYIFSDNEGHIGVKLVNPSDADVVIKQGQAYMQGIITRYLLTDDDAADGIRNGGFGSTTK